jgi:hypothetical protein
MKSWGWTKLKKRRMKYFSFDKIPYLYDSTEDITLPLYNEVSLDPDLKVAG